MKQSKAESGEAAFRIEEEELWQALRRRDPGCDGRFWFGVVTTGVYCRPSCACRRPLRKNVRFFASREAAERAGFRPCKRCRPDETDSAAAEAARIQRAAAYIREQASVGVTLKSAARHAGMSPFHFQRRFRAVLGVSPRQYLEACRLETLKGNLKSGGTVTEAIYAAGFGSGSRVYERVDTRLGMTPAEYRKGGAGIAITYASTGCALGRMMLGATDRGLCFVQFADSDDELFEVLRREYPAASITPLQEPYPPHFHDWMLALEAHLRGAQPRLDLPLDVRATAFQMRVWRYLQSIPYASVQSYAEVAAGIGQPKAARAVAHACASNRVALAIPCHRVIRSTGELGGYRWGLERKRTLLDTERTAAARR